MAEDRLDDVDRRPVKRQLGSHGMPETVRVDPLLNASLPSQPLEEMPHVGGVQRIAMQSAEQMTGSDTQGSAAIPPALDGNQDTRVDTDDPRLAAFTGQHSNDSPTGPVVYV